jgi:hypothetical protein
MKKDVEVELAHLLALATIVEIKKYAYKGLDMGRMHAMAIIV